MSDPVLEPASNETKTWGMFIHLSALSGLIGVPFGHIAGPLILWLIKKDQNPTLDAHGKEALNFQITSYIWFVVTGILIIVLIGIVLLPLALLANLILTIVGAMKANNGEFYRYPFTIRFLK
jgi:uncharacterized protein